MEKLKIDDTVMDQVEILAQLSIAKEERESFMDKMQEMMDYAAKLKEADTEGVKPLTQLFSAGNVYREDIVTNGNCREKLLAGAPEQKDGQFCVPKTVR